MKNVLLGVVLCLIHLQVLPQKVTVKVIKGESGARSAWQILDEDHKLIIPGNEFPGDDSVTFSLDANIRYFLAVSVFEVSVPNADLYKLIINNEPIMLLKTDIGTGDHYYPFVTGVREEKSKIVGGTTAFISDFPWQVYYISGTFRCGASIIADKWILTAAHCTRNNFGTPISVGSMSVKVGANNPYNSQEGTTYQVSEVIVHDGFDSGTLENDIALLKLSQPVISQNAKPIKLITSTDVAYGATDPGVMSWVTGWGLTHVNPSVLPTSLQKVQLPIVTNAQASVVWSNIPSTDVMAGYLNGNKDACSGDSGGPMAVLVVDEYKIAGIVSWGSQNCNTYGGYTRVSALESWIREKTGIPKEYWPPVPTGNSTVCQGQVSTLYSIPVQTGATSYEWDLTPASAGSVAGNTQNAEVFWNPGFTGNTTLLVRATINNVVSEWSKLNINVVLNTKLNWQSGDTSICAGQPVTLKVLAEGSSLGYKWYKNGVVIPTATSNSINFVSAVTGNSGIYRCEIKGFCNSVTSADINLIVHPLTNITYISPDVSVPFGNDVTLEVISEGHNLTYLWQKDGVNIENSEGSKLYLYDLNASDIGLYKSIVTGTCGTEKSDSVYVYVQKTNYSGEPEVFLWPSVTTGELNVALSNDAVYKVTVYNTSGQVIKELSDCQYQTKINVSSEASGTYIIRVYNNDFRKSLKFIKN